MNAQVESSINLVEWKTLLLDSLKKLSLLRMFANPVMFVVWIGTLLCGAITLYNFMHALPFGMPLVTTLILFFTVWFANLAESVAEAKSRGQASSLRSAKQALRARRIDGEFEHWVEAAQLVKGDQVRVVQGDYIPADGDIVKGWRRSTNRRSPVSRRRYCVKRAPTTPA